MTDTLQARLREMGERHVKREMGSLAKPWCSYCRDRNSNYIDWPCDAAQLVDALEVAVEAFLACGSWGKPSPEGAAALASIEEKVR